ncbi:MAG: DUF47 family protein [Methylovirgula sp.]|uniref:DUF47 family protein n=1 Tax=Methylovirgula sp. TaxID=1978224 RepID=UPI0030765647
MKSEIVEWLGQSDLLLPQLIAEGLAANDRVKARLSVLQTAAQHARDPQTAFDLTEECRAAGLDPLPLQALVKSASLSSGEIITATGLAALGTAIWADITAMLQAVHAGDGARGEQYEARLAANRSAIPLGTSDNLAANQIVKLTAISAEDSLHRLIMDLHRALNTLAATHAQELVAGAHAYGLTPDDKTAVKAFMRGVEATRDLKFGHPGLATTAMRSGSRLTIQNDIGETDAHVVVIGVEADSVTITYTDVHHARAKFFADLLRNFPVQWNGLAHTNAAKLHDEEAFYLVTGRFAFHDAKARDHFLEELGASLVFLIDWNKARKVLREFVANADAVRILDWAALHRVGHRGFIELGGATLVTSAVRHAASARIGFGERLAEALGRESAVDFLKAVLRISVEALKQGGSERLAKAGIEEALVAHLQRADTSLLAIVIRQAGLAREIAAAIAQFLDGRRRQQAPEDARLAQRASRIEEKADRIALEARSKIARLGVDRGIERLVDVIEQTIDELEEAAFVATLLPKDVAPEILDCLIELCGIVVAGIESAAIGTASATEISEGQRVDFEDTLAAVTRLIEDEHRADVAERVVTTKILTGAYDLKTSLSVLSVAHPLERATDQLARFGHSLRDHVLADLST